MTKLPRICPYCSKPFARLDRHLDSRHACGRAAREARTRRAPDPTTAAVASRAPETGAEAPRDPAALPEGLGAAGSALWRSVVDVFHVDQHLAAVLEAACREADIAAAADLAIVAWGPYLTDPRGNLRAHPALAVGRSSRLAVARLLRALELEKPG